MLSRNVAGKIIEANDPTLPFINIVEVIKNADISFANLESPFLDKPPYAQQGLVFKADPKTVEGIKFAGFDILSTANNHGLDQGRAGVEFTLKHLADHGLVAVGSGLDCPEGKIIEKNGIKFGFLAYSYAAYNDGTRRTDPLICHWEKSQIQRDAARLKPKVDFLIVSFHAGTEYKRLPDQENIILARAAIDAGADMIVGHHPHWIQTIEQYKEKWIFYSLGNFVFDQMWSQETREGLAVLATFKDKNLDKIELRPVLIDNFCCPRWALSVEAAEILKKINPEVQSNFVLKNSAVASDWINHVGGNNLTSP
jgi:poly-gamma-glutamate synthesis protein (capsule biosynthesis protein)